MPLGLVLAVTVDESKIHTTAPRYSADKTGTPSVDKSSSDTPSVLFPLSRSLLLQVQ
jgi:hypothetical protein